MFVKICGTTNLADAELAVELGADALGFIFAPSKRRVTLEQVAAITARLPESVERVGVFTKPDATEIVRTVKGAGLSAVQMHFPYVRQFVTDLHRLLGPGTKLWQVFGIPADPEALAAARESAVYDLADIFLNKRISVVLMDAVKDGNSGGLGVGFPWSTARGVVEAARFRAWEMLGGRMDRLPDVALAGGLNAANVRTAMLEFRPWGVDVVTGVERTPGTKDPDRLRAFLKAIGDLS